MLRWSSYGLNTVRNLSLIHISITFIRIVVELEETFNIEIPDEFLLIPEMNTVEKMMNIVLAATEMMSESISE